MDLTKIQDTVKKMSIDKGWEDCTVEERLNYLDGELQELKEAIRNKDIKEIGYEAHDVIWNCIDILNKCGIDLNSTWIEKEYILKNRSEDVKHKVESVCIR